MRTTFEGTCTKACAIRGNVIPLYSLWCSAVIGWSYVWLLHAARHTLGVSGSFYCFGCAVRSTG